MIPFIGRRSARSELDAERVVRPIRIGACVLSILVAVVSGCSVPQPNGVQTVARVDVSRYLGQWFEIARFPNGFQDACIGDVTARYAARPDGRIDVTSRCGTADGPIVARGVARIADTDTSARLEVRFAPAVLSFLPFVWGDYWILGLGHDYSWAVVGSPDREYLWILSRTPELGWEDYTLALATASANGFAVERLIASGGARGIRGTSCR